MMIEIISAIAAAAAVMGVWLNNHQRRHCFVLWMASNGVSVAIHISAGLWTMAGRDVLFFLAAIHGWKIWSRKQKKESGWNDEAMRL